MVRLEGFEPPTLGSVVSVLLLQVNLLARHSRVLVLHDVNGCLPVSGAISGSISRR